MVVVELNRQAYETLKAEKHLGIVPGAAHLLEDPETLQEVAHVAAHWFKRRLEPNREVKSTRGATPKGRKTGNRRQGIDLEST